MEIKIDKSFQKDTRRIKDKTVLQKVANTIANVQRAKNLDEIKNLKKISKSEKLKSFIKKYKVPSEYLSTNRRTVSKAV